MVYNSSMKEKTLKSKNVFSGKLLHLYVDEVELEDGHKAIREVIRHCEASAILAIDEEGRVLMEKQFRYPYGDDIYEIPAGKADPKEDPMETAKRELAEETGYQASQWAHLGDMYPSCAYTDEVIHIYLAQGLTPGERRLDEGESLDYRFIKMADLKTMVKDGLIKDGKTLAALTFYQASR